MPQRREPPRTVRGFTVMEILVAVTLISVAMLPILYLASANVEGVRVDRTRILADTLALSILERFGRFENDPWELLDRTDDPRERTGVDVWKMDRELIAALEDPQTALFLKTSGVKTTVRMVRDVDPGLHLIVSEVSWDLGPGTKGRRDSVSYSRFLAKPVLQ